MKLTSRVQTVSFAGAGLLDDGVGRVDVYVEVVIGAALERVGAGAAVQDIPAVEADERVVAAAPDQPRSGNWNYPAR